jgi:hypothetical protein
MPIVTAVLVILVGIMICVAARLLISKVKKLKQRKKANTMSTTATALYKTVKQESPQMKGRSEAKGCPPKDPSDLLESQYENAGHNVPG